VRPRHCAYGAALIAAGGAGLFGFISLFNNSTGPDMIAIHDLSNNPLDYTTYGFTVQQGIQGSNAVNPTPVVTGEATPVGLIYSGTVGALPTVNYFSPFSYLSGWAHEFPFAVLQPGWSITAFTDTSNYEWGFGFWYQVIHAEDLTREEYL